MNIGDLQTCGTVYSLINISVNIIRLFNGKTAKKLAGAQKGSLSSFNN
jgi:hypothetical protein